MLYIDYPRSLLEPSPTKKRRRESLLYKHSVIYCFFQLHFYHVLIVQETSKHLSQLELFT